MFRKGVFGRRGPKREAVFSHIKRKVKGKRSQAGKVGPYSREGGWRAGTPGTEDAPPRVEKERRKGKEGGTGIRFFKTGRESLTAGKKR